MDFHRTVHPILREFGFPVTLYLTTYYCLTNKPVFPPALSYILWKGRERIAPYPAHSVPPSRWICAPPQGATRRTAHLGLR